jgi:transposase InsO family protein
MSELPSNVWGKLSNDFCGPFPSGYYLMVIIDEYSRYPVVESLTSLTAKSVIPLLVKTFSIFGIPKELISDNGPPFNSQEFRKFADNMGFKHRKLTPLWPRANAESERFMKTIRKAIRAAHTEHRSWKQKIHTCLRNYRATPHATTDMSPGEILFGKKSNTNCRT